MKEQIQTILADTNIPIEERIARADKLYADAVKSAASNNQQDEEYATLLSDYAQFLYEYARYSEALQIYLREIAIVENLYGPDHLSTAQSYYDIGKVYFEQGDYNEALIYFKKAFVIRENILGENHSDTATSIHSIGLIYDEQEDYDKALDFYNKALDIRERVLGKEHIDTAQSYNNIGIVYHSQGEYDKALEFLFKALDIIKQYFGEEHYVTASTYNNIGLVYFSQGEYDKALENFSKAIKIREQVLGEDHPDTAWSYNNIGEIYYRQENFDKALENFKMAIKIRERVLDKNHPIIADSYNNIGKAYKKLGEYKKALKYYEKALVIRENVLGKEHPKTAVIYNDIGDVYDKIGEIKKAQDYYSRSIPIIEKKLGVENPQSPSTQDNTYDKNYFKIINDVTKCTAALNDVFSFHKELQTLADDLREMFHSEYCAIGIVYDNIAEDYIVSLEPHEDKRMQALQAKSLESVRIVYTSNKDILLCRALDQKSKNIITFEQHETRESESFDQYKNYIMKSGTVDNITVIPLRDEYKKNIGFVQFVNSREKIDFNIISPLLTAFLGLTRTILDKNTKQRKENREKDFDFYDNIQQTKNTDDLLEKIMKYLSEEFNAAIVSFRIPIADAPHKKLSHFYLRNCYVNGRIKNYNIIKDYYYNERVLVPKSRMGGYKDLCKVHKGQAIFNTVKDTSDYNQFNLDLYDKSITLPVFRNDTTKRSLIKQLYGTFQLKFFKPTISTDEKTDLISRIRFERELDDTKKRLTFLSEQITLLFNSYVHRFENESLQTFQNELKNSSFVKIQDFDERCVNIIKKSVRANVCSIYRYDKLNERLALSATTARSIHLNATDENVDVNSNKDRCVIPIASNNNILVAAFKDKRTMYIYDIRNPKAHQSIFIENLPERNASAMVVPLVKKDGECLGIVFLLGKESQGQFISTAYWEHDISHVEFIVNTLTRISESDNERLAFLSQLSHELLAPVTELVYDNDFFVNLAEQDTSTITKQQLVSKLQENIDMCMLLKYIISDTEFRYATSGRNMDYNIVKQDRPQVILLDAIRLLEKEALAKGLTIRTDIPEMPPMYFDKERMMQVFLNLLKNAIRYSDGGTIINVSYQFTDNFHEIIFANYGIGVQDDEKERIFELFYRAKDAKGKFVRGTGIGLFIVRDIMRAHGGDCYVRRLKNPTEFVISLPNK